MKQIGYVGLGIMGQAMANNLIGAGYELTVWNRTAAKAAPLTDAGATVAEHPAAVAAAVDVVCLNVTDTPDVEEILFGPNGVAEGGRAGLIVIDNSTISPDATRQFAARLAEQSIHLLDAPVSGGDVGARAGTLSVMVGGDATLFQTCLPIFEAVGKTVTHVGPSGAGQATKACNQVLCGVNLMAVCEAMSLAAREGLDLQKMLAVTTAGAGGSWALANLGPQIADADMSPGFMIDLINKDLAIVASEAKRLDLHMDAANLATERLKQAGRQGYGRNGTQALSQLFEPLRASDK
jgi:3-hydroxyisobutyrate dehydrogenase-like beta-hydroxyacid dehydrogenase